jgi:DnaJ-class molecular chaperone
MRVVSAKDYHKILGIPKNAKKDEIRKAYRRLALIYHPDRNKDADAGERFREINEAYRVLSGLEKQPSEDPRTGAYRDEWTASVIKIWNDIMSKNHDNSYR